MFDRKYRWSMPLRSGALRWRIAAPQNIPECSSRVETPIVAEVLCAERFKSAPWETGLGAFTYGGQSRTRRKIVEGDVLAFAQVMTVIMVSLAAMVGVALVARIFWRIGSRVGKPAIAASTSAEELQRLQNAVDAIAIEVERISEAQRFTVTLLSNKLPPQSEAHAGASSQVTSFRQRPPVAPPPARE
jgi:hypothetical protein